MPQHLEIFRTGHFCAVIAARTFEMAAPWEDLPRWNVFALCYHPEELANAGIANFTRNIAICGNDCTQWSPVPASQPRVSPEM